MAFLTPAALALGLLALPILLLYMLRLRRRDQPVSSTLLWSDFARDRTANAPWQRLRRNWLLLLQLLVLAALVLALMQPVLRSSGRIEGNVIVLLDASASMSATDGPEGQSRFEAAQATIDGLINNLGNDDRMTLIATGHVPVVLTPATNDKAVLKRALASATTENGPADWPAAFALVAGLAQGMAQPRVLIVSDGGLPDGLPALPAEVAFLPVGWSGDNLAVSTLGVRPAEGGLNALVGVTNAGPNPGHTRINLYLDGVLFDAQDIELPPGETQSASWALPDGVSTIEARLEPIAESVDHLAIDDRAWWAGSEQQVRTILLSSAGNLFLERFFAILPGYEVIRGDAAAAPDEQSAGFTVLDSVPLPDPLPPGNLLIVNPQPSEPASANTPPIAVTGSFTNTQLIRQVDSPLLADVSWQEIHVADALSVEAPGLAPLIEAEGGPLLLAGESDGRRVVLVPFDLRRSDLPLQIAFPVIMANITDWLSQGSALTTEAHIQSGAIVPLFPDERAESMTVLLPDGARWEHSVEDSFAPVLFDDTHQTGIYTVLMRDSNGTEHIAGEFAVNFFDAAESRIQPASSLRIGQIEVAADEGGVDGTRELWPIALSGALLLLLLEWWIAYRRRTGRPLLSI